MNKVWIKGTVASLVPVEGFTEVPLQGLARVNDWLVYVCKGEVLLRAYGVGESVATSVEEWSYVALVGEGV
jgi:hypothetical protein